jgi:dipeptidyl aminopeptidase/acylaminoacyl peptidase
MVYKFFVLIALLWFSMPIMAQAPKLTAHDKVTHTTTAARPPKLKDIPASSFATLPSIEDPEISPNGQMIAGLIAVEGKQKIAVVPIQNNAVKLQHIDVSDNVQVTDIRWVNDENLIVTISSLANIKSEKLYMSRLFAVHVPTNKLTMLLSDSKGQNAAEVLWVPKDGSNHILVAAQYSLTLTLDKFGFFGFHPSVYRVDVTTGEKTRIQDYTNFKDDIGLGMRWSVDATGTVRSMISYNDRLGTSRLFYKPYGSESYKTIDRKHYKTNENPNIPFMYVPETDNGYVFRNNSNGFRSIYEINILTGETVKTIFDPQDADVESVYKSADETKIIGVTTSAQNNNSTIWLTPEMIDMQSKFDESIKGAKAHVESMNGDQNKMIVRLAGPDIAGELYLYDHKKSTFDRISSINATLGSRKLSPAKMIQYKARDGLQIEGILTVPKNKDPKSLPLVVMPHGGPWAHDTLSYDYWTQFIASRGYAVLQPNFRGSTGYGTEFTEKGKGQMGLAMQDDITDGVKWAVANGIVDAKRVCIMGASYGGYAAMWGIVKDPGQYRCAISIAGVSNIRREVNDFRGYTRGFLYEKQWEAMTPDFNAVSPSKFVEKIKTPLLLIHGKNDITVDHYQSERMFALMTRAKKSVEFVSIPTADHYFTRESDRNTLLTTIENFLEKYNPADK